MVVHTLRRSKSKYGRTRRQRKKQKRTQGGGIFQDFVNTFKPSTPEEKCEKAKKNAEEICNSISQETPALYPEIVSDVSESRSVTSETMTPTVTEPTVTEPLMDGDVSASNSTIMSSNGDSGLAATLPPMSQISESALTTPGQSMVTDNESSPIRQNSVSPLPLASEQSMPGNESPIYNKKYNGLGGTKSKRKNKKRNKNHRNKSKKHKK
jgi:hypothetical protein